MMCFTSSLTQRGSNINCFESMKIAEKDLILHMTAENRSKTFHHWSNSQNVHELWSYNVPAGTARHSRFF